MTFYCQKHLWWSWATGDSPFFILDTFLASITPSEFTRIINWMLSWFFLKEKKKRKNYSAANKWTFRGDRLLLCLSSHMHYVLSLGLFFKMFIWSWLLFTYLYLPLDSSLQINLTWLSLELFYHPAKESNCVCLLAALQYLQQKKPAYF